MNKKTAIIIGSSGQDGKILFSYLKKKGYEVIGIDRRSSGQLNIDISDKEEVYRLVKKIKPDHVYFLAAYHKSAQDLIEDYATEFDSSFDVNVLALVNFLEGIRRFSIKTRIFYAASSLMFGGRGSIKKTEKDFFHPDSIYAITKAAGADICRFYRDKHGVFASVGILFNHESEYRTDNFVFMKVIKGALAIKNGRAEKIMLGDLKAKVDWGYAYDFIEAMYLMLKQEKADDFIIATGKLHSVKDLVVSVFAALDLDWKKYVVEDGKILTVRRRPICGDFKKLEKTVGWKPKHSFEEMIKLIIRKKKYESAAR